MNVTEIMLSEISQLQLIILLYDSIYIKLNRKNLYMVIEVKMLVVFWGVMTGTKTILLSP